MKPAVASISDSPLLPNSSNLRTSATTCSAKPPTSSSPVARRELRRSLTPSPRQLQSTPPIPYRAPWSEGCNIRQTSPTSTICLEQRLPRGGCALPGRARWDIYAALQSARPRAALDSHTRSCLDAGGSATFFTSVRPMGELGKLGVSRTKSTRDKNRVSTSSLGRPTSNNGTHYPIQAIYGVVFFGVSHDGMDTSSLILMVGDGPNRFLIESISRINSQILSIQQREFHKALGEEVGSEVVCFFETLESPTAQVWPSLVY